MSPIMAVEPEKGLGMKVPLWCHQYSGDVGDVQVLVSISITCLKIQLHIA